MYSERKRPMDRIPHRRGPGDDDMQRRKRPGWRGGGSAPSRPALDKNEEMQNPEADNTRFLRSSECCI